MDLTRIHPGLRTIRPDKTCYNLATLGAFKNFTGLSLGLDGSWFTMVADALRVIRDLHDIFKSLTPDRTMVYINNV